MSVYSELINDSGFDPGAPGPSASFMAWGYEHYGHWHLMPLDTDTAQIPVILDPGLFLPEVSSEDPEAQQE